MKSFLIAITLLVCPTPLSRAADKPAEFRFARIIGDGMVLQQEKPITLWGWAPAGAEVAVTLTQDPATGGPAASAALTQGTRGAAKPKKDGNDDTVTIRYVEKHPAALQPATLKATAGADGRWSATFPPAKASFQPTWIIAKSGQQTLVAENVLIGEIWLCAGQSNMAWVDFNRKDRETPSADAPALRYVAWDDSWYHPLDDLRKDVRWQECSPATARNFSAVPYLYGLFLHRYLKVPVGIINVARGGTTGDTWCLRDELDGLRHITVTEALRQHDAATATWDNPAEVKRIMNEWEQAKAAAKAEFPKKLAQAKAAGRKEPRLNLPKEPVDPRSGWSPPAGLFNATVMPIRHLGLRGVLYYQGENNVFMRWTRYEYTFPKVPVSFRKAFGDPNLPFACISQPGWGAFGTDPEVETVTGGYAIIRDIQRRALKNDPHAGMIATYPTGNSFIHPGEKFPVAEYASLWSLARVYGKPVVHRANEYQKMVAKGGRIHVYFDADPMVYERWKHIENNAAWQVLPQPYQGNAPIEGFIVAGKDRRWYPAKAKEERLDGIWTIAVWSDLVPEPVAVRYGWASWPTGNLVGRGNLPVATFRSDDWPIVEGVSYSAEAKAAANATIDRLTAAGQKQALDRKIRQAQVDVPKWEKELHPGDAAAQLQAKLARIEGTLGELQTDPWLANALKSKDPTLAAKIEALKKQVETLSKSAGDQGR
jgi:sialate O-acetylesterase